MSGNTLSRCRQKERIASLGLFARTKSLVSLPRITLLLPGKLGHSSLAGDDAIEIVSVRQLLIPNPMRLIGLRAEANLALLLVRLVVAFVPDGLALPLECKNVRRDAVEEPAVVADDDRTAA